MATGIEEYVLVPFGLFYRRYGDNPVLPGNRNTLANNGNYGLGYCQRPADVHSIGDDYSFPADGFQASV